MSLLLLAGTTEARLLARALAEAGLDAVASLAGATRVPEPLALPTRRGGFGGDAGFERYLDSHPIHAIIDATHPFATRISARTARIARARGLPLLHLLRPPWAPGPGDDWRMIRREEEAAAHIPPGARVFLATGAQSLAGFANLAGRELICRRIDRPETPFPLPGGRWLLGRGPFSVEDEVALFSRLGVDVLVVKNSGGTGSRPKLEAARRLGLPVVMIDRPPPPPGPIATSVEEALGWALSHATPPAGRGEGRGGPEAPESAAGGGE